MTAWCSFSPCCGREEDKGYIRQVLRGFCPRATIVRLLLLNLLFKVTTIVNNIIYHLFLFFILILFYTYFYYSVERVNCHTFHSDYTLYDCVTHCKYSLKQYCELLHRIVFIFVYLSILYLRFFQVLCLLLTYQGKFLVCENVLGNKPDSDSADYMRHINLNLNLNNHMKLISKFTLDLSATLCN